MRRLSESITAVRQCAYLPWKVGLAIVSAVVSAGMLRGVCFAASALLPTESWASEIVRIVMGLTIWHFLGAMGVASLGGAVSLFRELRLNMQGFTLTNALGHMITAQFAGLIVYLGAVEWTWSITLGLIGCALAGWGGNETITKINGYFLARAGMEIERKGPPA